jgi:hypothetical protein
MVAGLYHAIQNEIEETAGLYSNKTLQEKVGTIDDGFFCRKNDMNDCEVLKGRYKTREAVPREIQFQSIDYPGEVIIGALAHFGDDRYSGPEAVGDGGRQQSPSAAEEMTPEDEDPDSVAEASATGSADDADKPENDTSGAGQMSWQAAHEEILEVSQQENISKEELVDPIYNCIRAADKIVLVIPMATFLSEIVKRGNEPDELDITRSEERILEPESLDLGVGRKVEVRLDESSDHEWAYYNYPLGTGNVIKPAEYISAYKDLIRAKPDKDYVVVATMTDWVKEDFRAEGKGTSLHRDYEAARKHVDELIRETTTQWQGLMTNSLQDYPELVWYYLNDDDKSRKEIRTDRGVTILNKAERVLKRLRE